MRTGSDVHLYVTNHIKVENVGEEFLHFIN